jgi:alpha,alpha-trehalose phosphorylase
MVYQADFPGADPSVLTLHETIFHNANGYIGVRSNFEEGYGEGLDTIRGSYINGFYDFAEMKQAEKLCGLIEEKQTMLNVADTQGIKLFFDNEEFSLFEGEVIQGARTLNMEKGYTERFIHWRSPLGKEAEIRIRRLTSFRRLSLFLIDYQVRALNFSGPVRFVSTHRGDVSNYSNREDPRVAAETFRHLLPVRVHIEGAASFVTSRTAKSGLLVCTAADHILEADGAPAAADSLTAAAEGHGAVTEIQTGIAEGCSLRLLKYSIFTDSLRHEDCEDAARNELAAAMDEGAAVAYRDQERRLKKFWDNAFLEIGGDEKLNTAVQYNMYQLYQSAAKDRYGNIAAKGLSGEGYEGHFFWDTEMYIEPFFTLTEPEIAKNLISYR